MIQNIHSHWKYLTIKLVINNNQTGSAIDTVEILVKDANIEVKNPGSLQEEGNADEQ